MVTYEECLAFAGITEEEARVVTRLEGLTPMAAMGAAVAVRRSSDGARALRRLARAWYGVGAGAPHRGRLRPR